MSQQTNPRRKFLTETTRGVVGAGLTLSAANWNLVNGANERVRMGVIGTGTRGQDVMNSFIAQPDAEIVALCDAYDQHVNAAQEKTQGKAKIFGDYSELLASKEIDAVLIATPDPWHAKMAIDACNAGKDVYVEKPLTFAIEEGHQIIKAVKRNNRVMQVGTQQRSGEHYAEAKREFFDSGKIGKITLVRTWWHGNSFHLRKPNFTEKPAGLDWKKFLGPVKYRDFNAHQFYNWRAYLDFGGGQITDLFTHWIDVVHWYMGDDLPLVAMAAGGVLEYKDGRTAPDTITLQLNYPKEWVATFEATLVPGARGAAIEFMGTGGRLVIDRGSYTFQELQVRRGPVPEPVTKRAVGDLTTDHVKNFLSCVKSRKTPTSDVVSAHRSALASHLGKIAYIKGQRVTFDPATEKDHV
jgi:predicted dehydrogenase